MTPTTTASATFSGVVPPVATPLTDDGAIDHASLTGLVEYLITGGARGLFILGSTGETAYFSDEQRVEIARTAVAAAAGRVPIIAGAIGVTSSGISATAQAIAAAGVDAIVTTAPLYTLNSVAEVENHFRTVAASLEVPLWAYDVPVRVHKKLDIAMLVRLGTEGVIAGVKDSSGDDVSFRRLLAANEAAGRPLTLLTGHELVVDAIALMGADGVVPGLGNVEIEGYVRLWDAAERGDWEQARAEQERINRIFEIVFAVGGLSGDATGVGAFKAAMHARGLIASSAVFPGVERLSEQSVETIRGILGELSLLPSAH